MGQLIVAVLAVGILSVIVVHGMTEGRKGRRWARHGKIGVTQR
jgi:hypothetical protein